MEMRKYIDCGEQPSSNCSVKISGTENEVLKAAVAHAVADHGQTNTDELREQIRKALKPDLSEIPVIPKKPAGKYDVEQLI